MVQFSCILVVFSLIAISKFSKCNSAAVHNDNENDLAHIHTRNSNTAEDELTLTKIRKLSRSVRSTKEKICDVFPHVFDTNVTTPREWIEAVNEATNSYRQLHGVDPLIINTRLCQIAQYWANQIVKDNHYHHSLFGCGENLWRIKGLGWILPNDPVDNRYSEINNYDYTKHKEKDGKFFWDIGNFTQLVWKGTKAQCVAFARDEANNAMIVVAEYWPPGNVKGKNFENVLSTRSGTSILIGSAKLIWILLSLEAFRRMCSGFDFQAN